MKLMVAVSKTSYSFSRSAEFLCKIAKYFFILQIFIYDAVQCRCLKIESNNYKEN